MQIHIGHLIRDELRRQGRTNEWLAEQIGVTPRTLQRIFNKPTIDTSVLFRICRILRVDFFFNYSQVLTDMTDIVT